MKENKFRIWCDSNNSWVRQTSLLRNDGAVIHQHRPTPFNTPNKYTVEFFIGLEDIKEIEIYAGDIIIFDNTKIGGGKTTGEVIWNNDLTLCGLGWHLWVITTNIPKCHKGFMGMDWLGSIEIVGNIHEGIK